MRPSIFVSIAAYRDKETIHTINSLFAKASGKFTINVGICWQITEHDLPTNTTHLNVRNLYVNASESKGCCWARSRILTELYLGETYILCIDSHSRFIQNWDVIIVSLLRKYSKRHIFSTYPCSYEPPNTIKTNRPFSIQAHGKNAEGLPLLSPRPCESTPSENYFIGAGLIFCHGQAFLDVPYDPNIYFFGEEITLSYRFFSKGYTIMNPGAVILYHYYGRPSDPKHWTDNKEQQNELFRIHSIRRVKHIMGIEHCADATILKDIEKYAPGNERTLEEYLEKIDYKNLQVMT